MSWRKRLGRFQLAVNEHKGEASLAIKFILGDAGEGFVWYLRLPDVINLRELLGEATPHLERLHTKLRAKKEGGAE